MRCFPPAPIQLIWDGKIDPGEVFDPTLSLDHAAEGQWRWIDVKRPRCC